MIKKLKIIILLSLATISIFFYIGIFIFPVKINNRELAKASLTEVKLPLINLQPTFYDESSFIKALNEVKKIEPKNNVYTIIVPHHLVAANYIAELIKMSSGRSIDTVVIIGPNHNNIGLEPVATVLANWQTPFGNLYAAEDLTIHFLADFNLISNQQAFIKEHAVGAMMPFIKYYLPRAKILPIIISSYAGEKEARELSKWLANNLGPNSLVIFSLDFSHYLTKDQADQKDKLTAELIKNYEIDKILQLNNDYVDTPAVLAIALILANQLNLSARIVNHTNSFDLVINKSAVTTSYFAIAFVKE